LLRVQTLVLSVIFREWLRECSVRLRVEDDTLVRHGEEADKSVSVHARGARIVASLTLARAFGRPRVGSFCHSFGFMCLGLLESSSVFVSILHRCPFGSRDLVLLAHALSPRDVTAACCAFDHVAPDTRAPASPGVVSVRSYAGAGRCKAEKLFRKERMRRYTFQKTEKLVVSELKERHKRCFRLKLTGVS
jgi:hypothetical protein